MTNNENSALLEKQFYFFKKVSLMDKFNFYEYLSIMLDGWVSIVSALKSVDSKIENLYFKEKISELVVFLSSGDPLHKAMKKMSDVFPQSETSIIEAWEKSGTLVDSLTSLAGEMKKLHELKSTIKTALTYPLIIIIFLVIAVMVVMTYVVPALIPLIEDAGVEKPFATVALIATSDFIVHNFMFLIISFIAVWFGIYAYSKSDDGKRMFDELFLSLPLVGKVYQNFIIASTSSVLGSLMNSWVPIIKALQLVGQSSNNVVYENLYADIALRVSSGQKLVESIIETDKQAKFFPSDFIQLLSVGEKTANIWTVCKKLNESYTREVNYSLANLTKWIEPIAILVAWVFVLWFAFAIFGAILKLTQTVG